MEFLQYFKRISERLRFTWISFLIVCLGLFLNWLYEILSGSEKYASDTCSNQVCHQFDPVASYPNLFSFFPNYPFFCRILRFYRLFLFSFHLRFAWFPSLFLFFLFYHSAIKFSVFLHFLAFYKPLIMLFGFIFFFFFRTFFLSLVTFPFLIIHS